ncbi:MAG: cation:proton antiporter [Rikenellaceae bacterium]
MTMFLPLLSQHNLYELPVSSPELKFLIILGIILFAPLILDRLRIPHILGLIIAGAVVGEHGLNILQRDSGIVMSGTAGLLYIMFLAGLEIDINEFVKNRWRSIVFGLYTFIIPMILGTLACLYILTSR